MLFIGLPLQGLPNHTPGQIPPLLPRLVMTPSELGPCCWKLPQVPVPKTPLWRPGANAGRPEGTHMLRPHQSSSTSILGEGLGIVWSWYKKPRAVARLCGAALWGGAGPCCLCLAKSSGHASDPFGLFGANWCSGGAYCSGC